MNMVCGGCTDGDGVCGSSEVKAQLIKDVVLDAMFFFLLLSVRRSVGSWIIHDSGWEGVLMHFSVNIIIWAPPQQDLQECFSTNACALERLMVFGTLKYGRSNQRLYTLSIRHLYVSTWSCTVHGFLHFHIFMFSTDTIYLKINSKNDYVYIKPNYSFTQIKVKLNV